MSPPRLMSSGTRKLSEVARHLILPSGIVSSGYPVVRDQCRRMGVEHDAWQQGLGRAILAKRADGSYAAGIGGVILSIPRQTGKTLTIGSTLFAMCVLNPGTKALWTAHRSRTTDETFKSLLGMARRKLIAPHMLDARQTNGQQEIRFRNGSRILFGAREAGFGRGFDDVDVVVFDEAQILSQRALDDMVPSTNVAENPLIFFMGTPPKPTDPSDVFVGRRRECLSGDSEDTLFVEVSADADADSTDRGQWSKANPSYPTRTKESAMLRMKKQLGEESFRREGLGIWDAEGTSGAIPMLHWARGSVPHIPEFDGPPIVAVDVRNGLEQSFAISVAARVDGEHDFIDLVLFEFGSSEPWSRDYIVSEVSEVLAKHGLDAVTLDSFGEGNGALLPLFEAAGIRVVGLNTADMRNGSVGIKDAIVNGRLMHCSREHLTTAAKGAGVRKSNEGFIFSQDKSSTDVTPLRAAVAAWWTLQKAIPAAYDVLDSFL